MRLSSRAKGHPHSLLVSPISREHSKVTSISRYIPPTTPSTTNSNNVARLFSRKISPNAPFHEDFRFRFRKVLLCSLLQHPIHNLLHLIFAIDKIHNTIIGFRIQKANGGALLRHRCAHSPFWRWISGVTPRLQGGGECRSGYRLLRCYGFKLPRVCTCLFVCFVCSPFGKNTLTQMYLISYRNMERNGTTHFCP